MKRWTCLFYSVFLSVPVSIISFIVYSYCDGMSSCCVCVCAYTCLVFNVCVAFWVTVYVHVIISRLVLFWAVLRISVIVFMCVLYRVCLHVRSSRLACMYGVCVGVCVCVCVVVETPWAWQSCQTVVVGDRRIPNNFTANVEKHVGDPRRDRKPPNI